LVDELCYVVDLHAVPFRYLSVAWRALFVASLAIFCVLWFFVCCVSVSSMSIVTVNGFSPVISTSMFSVAILLGGILDLMYCRAAFSATMRRFSFCSGVSCGSPIVSKAFCFS